MIACATIVRTLAVALWIGGMAALDFLDAPARFALLDRNEAVRLGQVMFERFNRVEIVLALLALLAAWVARSARWTIGLTVLMFVLIVVQAAYLTPGISHLAQGLDFVHRVPGDPRYAAIQPLHTAYAVLEVLIFVAGVVVLSAWARGTRTLRPRPSMPGIWLVDCGRLTYGDAWALQRAVLAARQDDAIPDVVLTVEHPPVVTVGRAGRTSNILVPRDLLDARGIEVHHVERGGDVTYHGPGQLVGYPIVNLRALNEDVVRYVRLLEAMLIEAVAGWGIAAERRRGFPGVWVGGAKIAAIGVAVKRKVTMHGFALNVEPDLSHFELINPCGLGMPVTSLARLLGRAMTIDEVRPAVARAFAETFEVTFEPVALNDLRARLGAAAPRA